MHRDMSSPMDASLATRNEGQLISTQQMVSRPVRVGNMREVHLASRQPTSIQRPQARRMTSLADINVDGLGSTTWKWLAVAAVGGVVAWHFTAGQRAKARRKVSAARAALSS
jgi:hypothetical protein